MCPRQLYPRQNSPPAQKYAEEIIDIPLPTRAERRRDIRPGPPWITEEGFVINERRSPCERRKNWH